MKIINIKRILSLVLTVMTCLAVSSCGGKKRFTEYSFDYFDTVTTVVGYASSQAEFDSVYEGIISRLEEYHKLYDIYNEYGGINNLYTVNEVKGGSHAEVEVDEEIVSLLLYAREIYSLTEGRTNVAMGSVLRIWHGYRERALKDPDRAAVPSVDELEAASEHCDIRDVVINEEKNTVYLSDPEMYLDVGAVAKGYATEQVARMLEESGVAGYVLNVGGNVRTVGHQPDGGKWTVGIEAPDGGDADKPYIERVSIGVGALGTSGSYQRFYSVDGRRYHHIIDPDTLYPAEGLVSVSVMCGDAGLADALSTALFTMSCEEGASLVESIAGVEALWLTKDGEIVYSSSFKDFIS